MREKLESYWWYITILAMEGEEEFLYSLPTESGGIGSELQELPNSVRVRIYYRANHELGYWMDRLLSVIAPYKEIRIEDSGKIENQAWHVQSQDAFPPLVVGKGLVVLAPWHKGTEPPARMPLYINPGSAFGTGYHESTQIALSLLEKNSLQGKKVLDIGTGSGILSIAAYKLGAGTVHARDIDPIAVEEVYQNFALNDIANDDFSVNVGDMFKGLNERVDFILANILFDVLVPVLPEVKEHLEHGGRAIFSGLLFSERAPFVKELEKAGLQIVDEIKLEDWWGVSTQVAPQ